MGFVGRDFLHIYLFEAPAFSVDSLAKMVKLTADGIKECFADTILRYLRENGPKVGAEIDWKLISAMIKKDGKIDNMNPDQCRLKWTEMSEIGKKRKIKALHDSNESDLQEYSPFAIPDPDAEQEDKAEDEILKTVELVTPNQIALPRNYSLMSYATFKDSPYPPLGINKVSISGAPLIGASYSAASCNFRHTKTLLKAKVSKVKKPN